MKTKAEERGEGKTKKQRCERRNEEGERVRSDYGPGYTTIKTCACLHTLNQDKLVRIHMRGGGGGSGDRVGLGCARVCGTVLCDRRCIQTQ